MSEAPKHYPAPPIEDAIPPTERVLVHLLEEQGDRAELYAALGTVQLRKGDLNDAKRSLKKALELDGKLSRMRTNLGVVLMELSEKESAVEQFKEALLHDPALEYATFHLATILEQKEDYEGALKLVERYFQNQGGGKANRKGVKGGEVLPELHLLAGKAAQITGFKDQAREYFEMAAKADLDEAKAWLIAADVEKAREILRTDGIVSAVKTLSRAYEYSPTVFTSSRTVGESLSELVKDLPSEQTTDRDPYLLLLNELLELGIAAEVFSEKDNLSSEEERWEGSVSGKNYPYGNYRLGIVYALQGKFMEALDELDVCKGKLPPKKQQLLKLDKVVERIEKVRGIVEQYH